MATYDYQVIHVSDHAIYQEFINKTTGKNIIAFDLEGVRLSRVGRCTIMTVGILDNYLITSYVIDLLLDDKDLINTAMTYIKNLLEDDNIIKIIHDCRSDSDVLYRHHNIKITNVFDTSVAQMIYSKKTVRDNLNNTLLYNNCKQNKYRPELARDFYKNNPEYWGSRPMTGQMIDHAGSDVLNLHELYDKYRENIDKNLFNKIKDESTKAVKEYLEMPEHKIIYVHDSKMGRVIGRNGCNLALIQKNTGAIIACNTSNGFLVLAPNNNIIDLVERMIKSYC
jgi:ribonuclease D